MPKLPFTYTIRRSPRVSRMRIVVTKDKIEVVAPPKVAEKWLHQFVSEKRQWIMQASEKVASKSRPAAFPSPMVYGEGVTIPYQGQHYPLTFASSPHTRINIDFTGGFVAYLPESLNHDDVSAAVKPALTAWLKQQTRSQVMQLIHQHGAKRQLLPRSVIIKTQKNRWGSCGIHNDININWLLIMAPPEVLEYVVVHELCHIQVRNHSAQFWALVAEHLPDYQTPRQWLKQQGGDLMGYGLKLAGRD